MGKHRKRPLEQRLIFHSSPIWAIRVEKTTSMEKECVGKGGGEEERQACCVVLGRKGAANGEGGGETGR